MVTDTVIVTDKRNWNEIKLEAKWKGLDFQINHYGEVELSDPDDQYNSHLLDMWIKWDDSQKED